MAFTIGLWAKSHQSPFVVGTGGLAANTASTIANHFELADQFATTSPVLQTPQGIAWARIVGRQKGFVSGTGTAGPIYELQVAYDSGFTSQLRAIARYQTRLGAVDQSWVQEAVVPDAQTYTFARVAMTLSLGDAVTCDFLIDFIPGY